MGSGQGKKADIKKGFQILYRSQNLTIKGGEVGNHKTKNHIRQQRRYLKPQGDSGGKTDDHQQQRDEMRLFLELTGQDDH